MPLDAPVMPGAPLTPTEKDRTMLGRWCVELTTQLQQDNKDFFSKIETWWKWYDAQPLVEKRSDPWTGASNVVIPLVRIHSDAIKARLHNTVFAAPDLWSYRTYNVGGSGEVSLQDIARESTEALNWAGDDNEFDLYTPSTSWFDEGTIIGSSVMLLEWTSRKRYVFTPGEGGKPRAVPVELGRGPLFKQFPREQCLWQSNRPIADSEYLILQSRKTWSDLVTMEQFGEIDEGYLDQCKPEADTAAGAIREAKEAASGQKDPTALYDIRQAWIEMPTLRGLRFEKLDKSDPHTPLLPLVVTFDMTTGTVLRVKAKPYYTRGWPAYEHNFRTGASQRNPSGVAKLLEPLQRGSTTGYNQMIDSVTLANSFNLLTSDRTMLTQRFTPGRPIFANQLDMVREVVLSKAVAPDIATINLAFSIAERLTGISDPSLGREIRYGGHPSPATSTAMMLQESKELQRATTQQVRLQFSRMAEDILTLYQQFETKNTGVFERTMSTADGVITKSWRVPTGPIAGTIGFDLKAMTETLNPEAQREQAIFQMQATASFYSQVLQLFQFAANPQSPPPAKLAAIQAIKALNKGFERVLESAQVDDVRQYLLDFQRSGLAPGAGNAITGQLTGNLEQLAANSGQRPLPPISSGANGVPMASQGAVGPGGL